MKVMTADSWFETKTLSDGVTYIGEPHIKEFYRCNMWHVHGRELDMLIDTGMGVVSLREQIPLLTERSLVAVASHTHFDHIGGHYEFTERIVHREEAELLDNPTRENTFADKYVKDDIFTALPPAPYSSTEYTVKSAPATRIVEDGDVIDLGNRVFEFLHTPGHSPGSVVLWEASTGILFSGDIVYDGPLIEDHIDHYIASMERLLALPVRVVHGGHFPSYGGERHRQIIGEWLKAKGRG